MKKFIVGSLITLIGLVFSAICFIYAICNPCIVDGTDGLLGALIGNDILFPFIISAVTMCIGIALCAYEAYRKVK